MMGGHPEDTHRHGYRFRTGIPAEVIIEDQTYPCDAQNISRSGALLVGDFPAPTTELVSLALRAPGGGLAIELKGRVIRIQSEAGSVGLQLALEFVEMDDERHDAIEILLARILESPATGPLESLKPGSTPQEIKKTLEAIPISQRIALSSRANARDRDWLRSDTNPAVLEALAHNPQLLITEARLLASSPYLMPGTLDALSNDPRFKGDEELCLAIAAHPRVSLATAEKVTVGFKVPLLKKLLARPGLNPIVREKIFKRSTRG
jgi:hypothetical protein